MKLYKLTDQHGNTQNNTHWDIKRTYTNKKCKNPRLCSSDVFHAYTNINLAFLLNPIHANVNSPLLWECKGTPVVSDWGKVGCFRLDVLQRLTTPSWVNSDKEKFVRVAFAVLCAESVLHYYEEKYPNDKDKRPRKAIDAARAYLINPSAASAAAASAAAASAAYAAYDAASATTTHTHKINFGALADKAVEMI